MGAPFDDLRETYQDGNLIVFAGAGVSTAAGLPSWKEIAEALLDRARGQRAAEPAIAEIRELIDSDKLVDALCAVKLTLGQLEFNHYVERALDDKGRRVPELAHAIAGLRPRLRAVLTTNLDRLAERAFGGDWPVVWEASGDIASRRDYILKLRGTLQLHGTWVFSREPQDRQTFASPVLRKTVEALFRACPVLFVGCDLDDDLEGLLAELRALSGKQPPVHFAIVPGSIGPYHRRKLEDAGVRLLHEDALTVLRSLKEPETVTPPRRAGPTGRIAQLPTGMPLPDKTRRPRPSSQAKRDLLRTSCAHLRCDRAEPWEKLMLASKDPRGHVVLLCGDIHEGHSYFLSRIELFGRSDFNAEIMRLKADVYDHDPHDVALALRDHLPAGSGSPAAAIARILGVKNLILLFPEANVAHYGPWLREYYTKALPDFIAKVEERGLFKNGVIVVQPVSWRPSFLDWIPIFSGRRRTLRLLRPIEEARRPNLRIWREELSRIRREHIEALFSEIYPSNPTKASKMTTMAVELLDEEANVIFEKLQEMTR